MAIVINGQTGIDAGHLPISNAGNTEIEGTLTGAAVTVASITANSVITQGQNVSPFSGFKNYIINGNFDVWQRKGKTQTTYIDEYTADRWKCRTVKDGVSHYTFLCAYVSNIANMPHNYMSLVLQDTNANRIAFEQRLEQSSLANKNVGDDMTISFFLGHNGTSFFDPSATMQLNIYCPTTVDNWTSVILEKSFIIGTIATMPAYGTKYAITFQLTQNMISFGLNFSFNLFVPVGTAVGSVNSVLRVAQVQLEEGSVATPFENRPYGLELSLCQRYFETTSKGLREYIGSGYFDTTTLVNATWLFRVAKRVAPTINSLPIGAMTAAYPTANGQLSSTASSSSSISLLSASISFSVSSAVTSGLPCSVSVRGDLGSNYVLTASAEL